MALTTRELATDRRLASGSGLPSTPPAAGESHPAAEEQAPRATSSAPGADPTGEDRRAGRRPSGGGVVPEGAGADTAAAAADRGPDVRLDRRRYPVHGTTPRELRRSLRENGRRVEGEVAFAWTDWSVDVGYEFRRSAGECRVVRPDVRVRITVTLPEWRGRADAPSDLAERWARDLAAMDEHETGHVRLARRAGRRVYDALDTLDPAPCSVLRERADAAADSALADVRRAQDAYDERTDHGRAQARAGPAGGR